MHDQRFIQGAIALPFALVLLAASAAARAELVPVPTGTAAAAWPEPESRLNARPGGAAVLAVAGLGADGGRRESAAAGGTVVVSGTLAQTARASSLWIYVTSVSAQQQSDTFTLLQSNLALNALDPVPPAQVPLPAAGWLLALGLLGMAGVRRVARRSLAMAAAAPACGLRPAF